MPLSFKPAITKSMRLVQGLSWIRWTQIAICVVVAWVWLRGDQQSPTPAVSTPLAANVAAVPGSGAAETTPVTGLSAGVAPQSSQAGLQTAATTAGQPSATATGTATTLNAPAPHTASIASTVINVIVGHNDTLDGIFRKFKLNLSDLASLRSMPGLKAHLDRLRTGERLHLTHRDGDLYGLERRLNESETLKVVRDADGLRAHVLQNPLEARTRTVRGTIDRSLFEAVGAAGGHDQTAVNLADIFAWDIDFVLDIQPGDSFAVTYQELYQDGVYVKDGPVLAAQFVNQGKQYRAVRYTDPDGATHYYTPDGRSMHKAFLRAPVEFTRISSTFNSARRHPILNLIRAHKGIDYAAPTGTPVHAAGDGRVRFAGAKGGYGNVVEIEHSRGIVTVYGHLSRFAKGIRAGQHVTQGSVIAYVGMTGLATGPHLHYEYRVGGAFKNPATVALPGAAPIEARWHQDFLARTEPLLATLEPPIGPALVAR